MMVGELVLPEVMVGMTDASTTRRPSMPRTRSCASTTAPASSARPMRQVPTGWKMVVPISPAARASASSVWNAAPGRYSSGRYRASAGCDTMRRVRRSESAATLRSASVDR